MTIRVRLKLSRQARSELTSALYVPSQARRELFSICAAINLDPSGASSRLPGDSWSCLPSRSRAAPLGRSA